MLAKLRAFLALSRFHFLVGPSIAYIIGALMAQRDTGLLDSQVLSLGLVTIWFGQLATQYFNEYYDQPTDSLNQHRTPFSGGSGVLLSGEIPARAAWWAGEISTWLAIASLLWLGTLSRVNLTTSIIFTLLLIGALGYSVPPLTFANRGWGELSATLVVAILVPLFSYNLQTGTTSLILILTCLPFAALIFANMLLVAIPDFEADQKSGKRTLVVILGQERAARLYAILMVVGFVSPWLTLGWGLPLTVLLAEMFTLPLVALSLWSLRGENFLQPTHFARNIFVGAGTVMAIGGSQIVGFLLVN